jgi:hypothetical protein
VRVPGHDEQDSGLMAHRRDSSATSDYLRQNQLSMSEVFTRDEMNRFKTLHDAGKILHMNSSYPGAEAQRYNFAVRGAQGMVKRGNRYYFRVRVPRDLRSIYTNTREIKVSVHTADENVARIRPCFFKVSGDFDMAQPARRSINGSRVGRALDLGVLVTLAGTDDASLLRGPIVKTPEQIGTETVARLARQAERSTATDHAPLFCGGLLHVWQHEFGGDRDRALAWAARMNGVVNSSLPWRPSMPARF